MPKKTDAAELRKAKVFQTCQVLDALAETDEFAAYEAKMRDCIGDPPSNGVAVAVLVVNLVELIQSAPEPDIMGEAVAIQLYARATDPELGGTEPAKAKPKKVNRP